MLRTACVTVKALQKGSYCRAYDLRGWESNISTTSMLVHDKNQTPLKFITFVNLKGSFYFTIFYVC